MQCIGSTGDRKCYMQAKENMTYQGNIDNSIRLKYKIKCKDEVENVLKYM